MDATDLAYAGAAEQARLVAAREVSATELVQACLDRIAAHDPELNAFRVVLAEKALLEARQADGRAGAGAARPLLGVPVAIKDDVDVQGEVTAFGSAAHGGVIRDDAEVVARLRAAGAIVIGKTHLPELAHLPATESLAWGASRNPWDPSRTPGGSSGGSAAAAAAGMCGVALGSDGAGSIRGPSAWCGLFGLKPQRERVPLNPHADAWQGLSVNGPMARTVADAALFLDATTDAGTGFHDALSQAPGPLRIAVSTKPPPGMVAPLGADERRVLEEVAGRLRDLGHDVVERDPDFPPDLAPNAYARVYRGIADDAREMPHPERLEPRVRGIARLGRAIPERAMQRIRAAERGQVERILRLWQDVDVLLSPSTAQGPYEVGHFNGAGVARFTATAARRIPYFVAWNLTGQPACSVPSGWDADGLPVGVQLVGRPHDEATLLRLSAQLEAAHPWADRRPPL